MARARWRDVPPEAGRLWVSWVPERWPGSAAPWVSLDRLGLGEAGIGFDLDAWTYPALDGVVWIPPTPAPLLDARRGLEAAHADRGTPVISQRLVGDPAPEAAVVDCLDLLPALVAGEDVVMATRLASPGGVVILPLVAGLCGNPEQWRAIAEAGVTVGVDAVVPMRLELEPLERRRLVEIAGDTAFEAVFHGVPPSEREVAEIVAASGVKVLPTRPLPRPPLRGRGNRKLAGDLLEAAELALRLEEPALVPAALFTAGRWIDATGYDVVGLVRDGVDRTVPELQPPVVREILEDQPAPAALDRRRRRWTGQEDD